MSSATYDSSHSISINHQKQQHQLFSSFLLSIVSTPRKNTGKKTTKQNETSEVPLIYYTPLEPTVIVGSPPWEILNIQLVMGLSKLIYVDMLWARVLARNLWKALPNKITLWGCGTQAFEHPTISFRVSTPRPKIRLHGKEHCTSAHCNDLHIEQLGRKGI